VELEQGAFLRIQPSTQRKLHPDLSRLARQVQKDQREQETFEELLDRCQLYPLGNDIFCDEVFHQTTQPRKTHNRHGEEPQPQLRFLVGHNLPEILIWLSWRQVQISGTITRLCLKLWCNLVSCVSTKRGFLGVSTILNREGRLLALEYWRCKGCLVVWRMFSSNI
jgi:hypothetical protein